MQLLGWHDHNYIDISSMVMRPTRLQAGHGVTMALAKMTRILGLLAGRDFGNHCLHQLHLSLSMVLSENCPNII